jgi:hypothetical protein
MLKTPRESLPGSIGKLEDEKKVQKRINIVKDIVDEAKLEGIKIDKRGPGRPTDAEVAAREIPKKSFEMKTADDESAEVFDETIGDLIAQPAKLIAQALNRPDLVDQMAIDRTAKSVRIAFKKFVKVENESPWIAVVTAGINVALLYVPVYMAYSQAKKEAEFLQEQIKRNPHGVQPNANSPIRDNGSGEVLPGTKDPGQVPASDNRGSDGGASGGVDVQQHL